MEKLRTILVLRFSSIGDIIQLTSPLHTLKNQFPNARIDIITLDEYAEILMGNPFVNRIIQISRNFKYPEIAKANSIEGRVFIQFVVEKTGKLSNIEILKGIDKHIDAAALQAVRSLNNVCGKGFSPARNAIGRPIRLAYTVPINCVLQ